MLRVVVDSKEPEADIIAQAGSILRNGGLVAFPTETVYGLGADAQNPDAVAKVYREKGRPSDNPLIWHGNCMEDFSSIADLSSDKARKLCEAFWPGPLTVVVPRCSNPALSLAIRVPSHPVTRALIAASGCFIAAPSANLSGRPSPTCAQHVVADFKGGSIDMLIDGGSTINGLESTVVSFISEIPKLLRPGAVTLEMLRDVIGEVECHNSETAEESAPLSPGMKYRHYSPKAPLILIIGLPDAVSKKMEEYGPDAAILRTSNEDINVVARTLFGRLRQFDNNEAPLILAEGVEEVGLGHAVMNRLKKAAAEVIYI